MEPASSKKLMKYDCFLEIIDMNNTRIGCSEHFVSSSRDPGRSGGKIEKTLFLQWERATCSWRCDGRRAGSRIAHLLCGHPLSDGALTFSATTAHQSLCFLNVLLWKFSPISELRMECYLLTAVTQESPLEDRTPRALRSELTCPRSQS